ncbi:MAG TPA: iron-containing alcohol dehydrogenase [Spirochaetota bacterium]|nr:iron-containing alcohol dehydrogenase [Spirochaetota bacterium]HPV41263.1 iron-containing alcohol dehydrogenase [Spirochaetota bacterium]
MTTELRPDFHLPSQIYIRQDIIKDIGKLASRFGSRAILVTTADDLELYGNVIEMISRQLKDADVGCIVYDEIVTPPNTEEIDTAAAYIKKTNSDLIIGFGSIDSINAAKALTILATNYYFCHDLFAGPKLNKKPMKFITIPGSPMFGFEIAPLFYLEEIHELTKKIYHNPDLYPEATIVDPLITLHCPEEKILKSGISTLALAAESVISKKNNDIINTYALKSIDMLFRNIPVAYRESQNSAPRMALSTSSVMTGIAFAVSFLSITLAISLALVSKTSLDIESAMSIILPHIMEFNLTSSPGKYVQMSKVMGEDVREVTVIEAAIKAVEAIRKLESDVDIPQRLSNYDISKSLFKEIADLAITYPFLENTPREVNTNEIETILIAAY